MKKRKIISPLLIASTCSLFLSCQVNTFAASDDTSPREVTLRICSWEEYIDLGDWADDEAIDLDSDTIIGENTMVDDFESWYLENYGVKVNVKYSTFGTNEELYNMLSLGDEYDLVCPSEYMIMKLMSEDELYPLSDDFFDTDNELNYYINGVSPYIQDIFESHEINDETWSKYMAGYMWGITGIVYNSDEVTKDEASTWTILNNPKFKRRLTLKDNVRDSYFAALGAIKSDLLSSEEFENSDDYSEKLEEEMNDVSSETMQQAQDYLQAVKSNSYSFETDSGKADMITGKVVANYQWSGDAVYTMDQAVEDDYTLNFAVPKESSNIYFDGWVMLKRGVEGNSAKQQAAEAFINFCSRPDNAIRNMNYIGYTSVISGGSDDRIFEYIKWNYGADDDESDVTEYDLSYFFGDDEHSGKYVINVPTVQLDRQLSAQYPSEETISRTSIMRYFDTETNEAANQMWIKVRCFNIKNIPPALWCVIAGIAVLIIALVIRKKRIANSY